MVQKLTDEGCSTIHAETEVFGIDHAEVGGWLATRWRFPDILVAPIESHHNLVPMDEDTLNDVLLVYLGNIMTKRADIGLSYEKDVTQIDERIESNLKLSAEKIAQLEKELDGEKEQIQEFFNMLTE